MFMESHQWQRAQLYVFVINTVKILFSCIKMQEVNFEHCLYMQLLDLDSVLIIGCHYHEDVKFSKHCVNLGITICPFAYFSSLSSLAQLNCKSDYAMNHSRQGTHIPDHPQHHSLGQYRTDKSPGLIEFRISKEPVI